MIAYHHNGHLFYWCEGCKCCHNVPAERWHWNGSLEKPSLHPSVRHFYTKPPDKTEITTCHYHLKNGEIQYCGDCQHALNGQTRPLIPIPDNYGLPGRD